MINSKKWSVTLFISLTFVLLLACGQENSPEQPQPKKVKKTAPLPPRASFLPLENLDFSEGYWELALWMDPDENWPDSWSAEQNTLYTDDLKGIQNFQTSFRFFSALVEPPGAFQSRLVVQKNGRSSVWFGVAIKDDQFFLQDPLHGKIWVASPIQDISDSFHSIKRPREFDLLFSWGSKGSLFPKMDGCIKTSKVLKQFGLSVPRRPKEYYGDRPQNQLNEIWIPFAGLRLDDARWEALLFTGDEEEFNKIEPSIEGDGLYLYTGDLASIENLLNNLWFWCTASDTCCDCHLLSIYRNGEFFASICMAPRGKWMGNQSPFAGWVVRETDQLLPLFENWQRPDPERLRILTLREEDMFVARRNLRFPRNPQWKEEEMLERFK